jgi:hypothetical protein
MRTEQPAERPGHQPSDFSPWLSRAWVALALVPVAFFLGLVVAQVLYTALGYKPENDDAPLWVDLVATVPALALFLVPCGAAFLYGRRASLGGDRRGLLAQAVGALVGVAYTVLSVVTLVASSLSGR